jgi:hypothetical protein
MIEENKPVEIIVEQAEHCCSCEAQDQTFQRFAMTTRAAVDIITGAPAGRSPLSDSAAEYLQRLFETNTLPKKVLHGDSLPCNTRV